MCCVYPPSIPVSKSISTFFSPKNEFDPKVKKNWKNWKTEALENPCKLTKIIRIPQYIFFTKIFYVFFIFYNFFMKKIDEKSGQNFDQKTTLFELFWTPPKKLGGGPKVLFWAPPKLIFWRFLGPKVMLFAQNVVLKSAFWGLTVSVLIREILWKRVVFCRFFSKKPK